jgi:hypothetical protein
MGRDSSGGLLLVTDKNTTGLTGWKQEQKIDCAFHPVNPVHPVQSLKRKKARQDSDGAKR